jgi:hypothetical protein
VNAPLKRWRGSTISKADGVMAHQIGGPSSGVEDPNAQKKDAETKSL